jgi:hypothetical protein
MNRLLNLAKTKLGCGYVWGSQGEILTPENLKWFKKLFGAEHYDLANNVSASKWIGKQVFDCSGLIVFCLRELGLISKNADYTAGGLYALSTPISKSELKEGDLVFIGNTKSFSHVGIYAGNNQTVEAMGTAKGVVMGNANRFNIYGRLKYLGLEDATPLKWHDILNKVTSNPVEWSNAITVAVNAAKADGNLGALEIFKYILLLIEKIYNSK